MPESPDPNQEAATNERFLKALLNPPPQFPEGEDDGWVAALDVMPVAPVIANWYWLAVRVVSHHAGISAKARTRRHEKYNFDQTTMVSPVLAELLREDYDRTVSVLKTIQYMKLHLPEADDALEEKYQPPTTN